MQNEYKYNPIHAKNKYENIVCQMAVIWTRPSVLTLLMLWGKIPAYLANTMPNDALDPSVARASASTVLTVNDRQNIGLLHCGF